MDNKKKFLFDLNYFDDDNIMHKADDPDAPPPAPTFSEEELEAAKKSAYEEGVTAGKQEALSSIEQQNLQSLQSLQQSLSGLFGCEEERNLRLEESVLSLNWASLTRLYPLFMETIGDAQIYELLQRELQELRKKPSLDITMHPDTTSRLAPLLEDLKGRLAAQGTWTFLEDEKLSPDACEVTWDNGGLDWHPDTVFQRIQDIFAPYLNKVEEELTATLDALDQNLHNDEDNGDNASADETISSKPAKSDQPEATGEDVAEASVKEEKDDG